MSKICEECGEEIKNENAKFCDKCGVELKIANNQSKSEATTLVEVVVCPHCGQTTSNGLTHCEKCGLSLKEYNIAIILSYIVTFILGIGLVGFLRIITTNFFAFICVILTFIPAIYLLTRKSGKAKTQGVFLIVLIILFIILSYISMTPMINNGFGAFIFLIIILLMPIGIFLGFKNYPLFK